MTDTASPQQPSPAPRAPRQAWARPALTRLRAEHAELGPQTAGPDSVFAAS